ncbi:MAG: fibronectin type III domain-containing protein, partial [Verrucomicrobiota bacterium]|nr:fibronectin type III domain-containing protein [Verrucomicrobiota bacterium]
MRNQPPSESAFFTTRAVAALTLGLSSVMLALLSFASTPSTGTLSPSTAVLTYDIAPFTSSNPTPVIQVDKGPECNTAATPCDSYLLNVSLPTGYVALNANASIKVTLSWKDTGSGNSDYDLYVFKGNVPNSALNGTKQADFKSASGANPEVASVAPLADGSSQYTIKVVPYTSSREALQVKIELIAGAVAVPGPTPAPFGVAEPAAPGVPRFQNFYPPVGSSAEASSGEFNIGFNPKTGRIMTMNVGPIWRLTPPEIAAPPFRPAALPECCEALWQDRSAPDTSTGLDPILWTDQTSGRTFASNSTAGANGAYAFSDNDGDSWVPVGAAPPDGADHQTIATGPYPPSLSGLSNPTTNQGQYTMYCSQTLVGANCQRSDNLGSVYGPAVVATGPGSNASKGCGGLHGHVRIAPNGTAWLPDKSCGSNQGGAISKDGGTTPWTEFVVKKVAPVTDPTNGFTSTPQADGADPSVALDADSRAYFAYVNNDANATEGHVHVAVSEDNGTSWIRDVDISVPKGIKNAVHVEAIGGSSGRAAVGFIGTNIGGANYEAEDFPGKWYAFVSFTYDSGRTWTTVNVTPNDPVQSMTGIWQQGGSERDRNTLDFNEITVDSKGRVLYGYSDGCVSAGCIDGTAPNDYTAHMRVARQTGGRTIFASNDANTDTTVAILPKPPCLSGSRTPTESLLSWKAPDNGGSNIINYQVFRSNSAGTEVLIGQTGNANTTYRDLNPPADMHLFYRVQAINAVGMGGMSNEIDLVAVAPPAPENVCLAPGLTLLTDKLGDTSAALGVTTTPAPPGSDLVSLRLSQPFAADGTPRLFFTVNTDVNPANTNDPGFSIYVAMKINGPDPDVTNDTSTVHYRGIRLTYRPTATYESYTPSPNNSGGVDGRFAKAGSFKALEPESNYNGPAGKLTLVAKASTLGLKPGDVISGFVSATSQT